MNSARADAKRSVNQYAVAGVVLLLAIIAVLGLKPGGRQTLLQQSIQSTGHFAFFGGLAFLAAVAAPLVLPFIRHSRLGQYAFGLAVSVGLGFALEFAQKFIPNRSPTVQDLVYDTVGAVAAIALLFALHHIGRRGFRWRLVQLLGFALFAGTFVIGSAPFASCVFDLWRRNSAMPTILTFQESWPRRFTFADEEASVRTTEAPLGWQAEDTDLALMRIVPGHPYPGLGMHEPYPNWSNYESFAFDLLPVSPNLDSLEIRIQDRDHNEDYYDRFNRTLRIQPGFQTIRIPISNIIAGPRHRLLDAKRIGGFKFFVVKPTEEVELYLGNFRLE